MNNKKLKILFLTPDDDLHLPNFFYTFFEKYNQNFIDVKGVVIQKTLGREKKADLIIPVLRLYGIWGFINMSTLFVFKKLLSFFCFTNNINFASLICILKKIKLIFLNSIILIPKAQ